MLTGFFWAMWLSLESRNAAFIYPIPDLLLSWSTGYKSLAAFSSFGLILIQAITFGFFIQRYDVLYKSTWLPTLFFGFFCLVFREQLSISSSLVANLFLILSFNFLFRAHGKERALPEILNTGMALGLATLFDPQVIFFLPVTVFGMYAFKPGRPLDILQLLLGITLPWYFLAALNYAFDWGLSLQVYWQQRIAQFIAPDWSSDTNKLIFFGLLAVLFGYIFLQVQQSFFRNTIRVRKYQQFMLLYFLSSLIVGLISTKPFAQTLIYLAAPLSVYMSFYFLTDKKKYFREFVFYLFLAGILMVQMHWF